MAKRLFASLFAMRSQLAAMLAMSHHRDVGGEAVLQAECEHLLCLGHSADQRAGDRAPPEDQVADELR